MLKAVFKIGMGAACGGLLALSALAQSATPTTEQMIEQLRPAAPEPRTRSMRNLVVKAAPSLSLLIQFDFDSARVKPESQQALANLGQALQSRDLQASRFAVEGHTDAKGRPDYNQRLSQQRADAVRDFLVQQGVQSARLSSSGKGSSELANSDDPLAAENRRVRIVNLD
ncbi:MAG: OmpA family protein [Rhodoferax sp.]